MWMFGLYIAIYFGMPAAVILVALIYFWRDSVNKNREAIQSGETDPKALKKLKNKKIALTIAVVIAGVMVAAIIVTAVLFSTAISFM